MFTLTDTFNDRPISRHHTLAAAVRAQSAHSRAVKRRNGENSYIPTAVFESGKPVNAQALLEAEADYHTHGWKPRRTF